jgi:hypothetical protein
MLVAPGMANKVVFLNQSAGSLRLTVKITGYTTDVYASDINGAGGSPGQVLTNTGTGATWQAPAPSRAYGLANNFTITALSYSGAVVAQLAVPAGSYQVTFNGTMTAGTVDPDATVCYLYTPANTVVTEVYTEADLNTQTTVTAQGLVSAASGGTITVKCLDTYSHGAIYDPTLIATAVATTSGFAPSIVSPQLGSRVGATRPTG